MYVDVRPSEFQFRSSKMKNHEKFRSDGIQKQLALVIEQRPVEILSELIRHATSGLIADLEAPGSSAGAAATLAA
jgi:hypothetical protein